ncbi:Dolichyl-diphosphooligosaccharide--protein glycosyltransferase subunit 1B [Vitis vinifera]|uniref:Dolichyl-diphosphooligosaccharide--protein glycosyltransferase subunit 1 n=1 Tax=Vitis vinifera TaxID=29760 RepID=A0A438HIY8_VITVI|nr:Dolichyl-diphosphooligosaccharide--protein glycosyltransferase subunit 1B [Vitis vinifera]
MAAPLRFRLALVFSVFALLSLLARSSSQDLQIANAERRIDLTSHIIKVFLTLKHQYRMTSPNFCLTFKFAMVLYSQSQVTIFVLDAVLMLGIMIKEYWASPASEILLAFPPTQVDHLAVVKAAATVGKRKKKTYQPLDVNPSEQPDSPNGTKYFSVSLLKPLGKGESVTLEVFYILTHSLEPFPVEISQSESQLVYYRDSAIILSPYAIKQQTTYIKTPGTKVESYTRVDPTIHAGKELKYGPYDEQPPYSYSPIVIHFENNNPFAVVEELVREVEISHWGSIQITEHYKLVHAGARHKGIFSRVEYQSRPSISGVSSFKHILARLPLGFTLSTTEMKLGISLHRICVRILGRLLSELEIEPRYPLFGGWKATFVIGYGVPLEDFLFESSDGRRYLNFTFGCPLVETVVDKLTVKVVLPEGSKEPSAVVPFPVDQHLETSYSYLDVVGRTVVVLEKKNVVPEHSIPFQVICKLII